MSRLKACMVALALSAVLPAGVAQAADEAWTLKTATGRLAFHPELARDLGIQVDVNAPADKRGYLVSSFEAAGRLELRAPGQMFRDIGGGELRVASTGVIHLGTTDVALQDMTIQRGNGERTLSLVANDGRIVFFADHMHFTADRATGQIRMFNLDLRLAPEAARALGYEEYTDLAVAVMELEGPIVIPGPPETPEGACTNPNFGLPDNDTSMINIGNVQQMATEPSTGRIAVAPDATVGNVGATDVPWYEKFSGSFPPYNNDQHPYLIWNMYRQVNGVMEQIGVSPLKHAFFTINENCACPGGNILWVDCQDIYSTGTNDSIFALTLRPELTAFTGVWQRCGSIFDPDCNNVENNPPPRANPMDRRMAVATADFGVPGATYYIDASYIVRDDTNIFNQGWRTINPHFVGGNWVFTPLGPMNIGVVLDQWVNPANPGPNAQVVPLNTPHGRLRVVVRAFDLGGGQWRYEYGVQNYDFDPRIKTFRVPLPPGVVATNPGFHDPDQDAANNWTATITSNFIVWTAPTAAAAQDYGTLFNFRFTANAAPSAAGGTKVTMRVQEVAFFVSLTAAIVGPGTPTTARPLIPLAYGAASAPAEISLRRRDAARPAPSPASAVSPGSARPWPGPPRWRWRARGR